MTPSTGDITEDYVRPPIEHLRGAMEKVATFLLEEMVGSK